MKYYVGIDPGNKGAIAILNEDCKGKVWLMPYDEKKKYLDIKFIEAMMPYHPDRSFIAIEDIHAIPTWGIKGSFQLGYNYGKIRSVLELNNLHHILVKPKQWKDKILVGTDKSKEAGIQLTQRAYPNLIIWDSSKNNSIVCEWKDYKRKSDIDGIADAICLALYAMRYNHV